MSVKDLLLPDMVQQMIETLKENYATALVASAFPEEAAIEERLESSGETFDAIENDEDIGVD